jgi:SAM-dependent methyltransferase
MKDTFANEEVLSFYKELPFNYGSTVDQDARRVIGTKLGNAYPILPALLRNHPRVLEVGCGVGWLSCGVALHGSCEVTAIDFNPVAIERARAIAEQMGLSVKFEVADLFVYAPARPAELVISLGVLHHTNNCHEAIRRCMTVFTAPLGHFLVGLYHAYGRRPFLQHFEDMKKAGATEEEMLKEYGRLHQGLDDKTHLYSWFRDQVLHPHETQHTLSEVVGIGRECGFELVATSINRFAPIDRLDSVIADEAAYETIARERLEQGRYFPGFFVSLFKRTA